MSVPSALVSYATRPNLPVGPPYNANLPGLTAPIIPETTLAMVQRYCKNVSSWQNKEKGAITHTDLCGLSLGAAPKDRNHLFVPSEAFLAYNTQFRDTLFIGMVYGNGGVGINSNTMAYELRYLPDPEA